MNSDSNSDSRTKLTQLWLESEGAVRAFVFAAVRGLQDAEDVVQQVALAAAKRFDEYDASRPFIAWVLWLAKSKIVDHYRQQSRQQKCLSDSLLNQLASVIEHKKIDQRSSRQLALEQCLERLPEKSRQMLNWRYSDDWSMETIAEQMRVTVGSIRVMFCRVRDQLASCIESRLRLEAEEL